MADWDSFSKRYDDIFLENPLYHAALDLIVGRIVGGEGLAVLDLGCGTGNIIAAVLDRYPDATVTGVDPSGGMLDKCTRRFEGDDRVRALRGDALEIPCGDAEFDVVLSHLVLHHVAPEDRSRCAREIARVTRPCGRLIYADMFCGVDAPPEDAERRKDIIEKVSAVALYCLDHGADDMAMVIINTLPSDLNSEGEYLTTPEVWKDLLEAEGFACLEVLDVPPGGLGLAIIVADKLGVTS